MSQRSIMHSAIIIVLGVALLAGSVGCEPASKLTLVSKDSMPDPFVIKVGNYWHVFGTAFHMLRGKSLKPESLKRVDLNLDLSMKAGVWGFTVYKHTDGSRHAYATRHHGRYVTDVIHLVPQPGQTWTDDHPITDWKIDRVLIPKEKYAYESKVLRDTDGTLYLMYTMAWKKMNCIMVHRMLDPATLDPNFTPRAILKPEEFNSEESRPGRKITEGGDICKINGKYVLVYTVGSFRLDNYKIALAYSDTLIPPEGKTYQKVMIPDPKNVWGNPSAGNEVKYLLQAQNADWPNYCANLVEVPGVGSIIESQGKYWLAFHGHLVGGDRNPVHRYLHTVPLDVRISKDVPMDQWISPKLPLPKDGAK